MDTCFVVVKVHKIREIKIVIIFQEVNSKVHVIMDLEVS